MVKLSALYALLGLASATLAAAPLSAIEKKVRVSLHARHSLHLKKSS